MLAGRWGEDLFFLSFFLSSSFFFFLIIMGIRLEHAASAGPGSFVPLSIGVISQIFFLATT